MKNVAILLIAIFAAACSQSPQSVSANELFAANQKWDQHFVRTCGYVLSDSKGCRLKVCGEGTPLKDIASCKSVSEIHLSTSSIACRGYSSRSFWAMIDGRYLALKPNAEFNDTNRFVIAMANVGEVPETCVTPPGGT